MKAIDKVYAAWSSRDDEALAEALGELSIWAFSQYRLLGPAVVIHQLHGAGTSILGILNNINAQAKDKLPERLAFNAGAMGEIWSYFESIADHQETDAADAQLSCSNDKARGIQIMILKSCFIQQGTRSLELANAVSRVTKASMSLVKFHIKKLVEISLLERTRTGPKNVYYRITRLGEAVLARRCNPHEVALFCIDLAASDMELRAAINDEIKRTWPRPPKFGKEE